MDYGMESRIVLPTEFASVAEIPLEVRDSGKVRMGGALGHVLLIIWHYLVPF
jgi:hypothetical protein